MTGDQERLAGNLGGVHRVGLTVRRPVGEWTPAVHALLGHLAGRLPHIPAVHGFDEHGRGVLDYLPGQVIKPDEGRLSHAQIRSMVSWTRDFHAAVADFSHPGPWRFFEIANPTLIGHNDIAPYNVCFDGDELVGVFDWDLAGPTTPLNELAFIAWNCVPLWSDIGVAEAAARLELITEAYGQFDGRQVLLAVPDRIQIMVDGIAEAAAAGDEAMVGLVAAGEQELDRASLTDLRKRIPAIEHELLRRQWA